MRLALYQPEIPQNTGTLLRLGHCLNIPVDIIEPCGFVFSDRRVRRSGMDYLDSAEYKLHPSWDDFVNVTHKNQSRIILITPYGESSFTDFQFQKTDVLLMGRESTGVPINVSKIADARVAIPMVEGARSINVAIAASIVLSEALRQTDTLPSFNKKDFINES
jgi:tRNA (cytidine/uridine-2'-O-)-methyltransferase